MEEFIFECPHCKLLIIVKKEEINCKIFRHGVLKDTLTMINPHSSKEICDELKEKDLIYGCGKPFSFDGEKVEIIDYI
jgi:hypothetical protein